MRVSFAPAVSCGGLHIRLIDGAAHQATIVGHDRCDRHLNDAARRSQRGVLRIGFDLSAGITGSAGCNTDAVRAAIETIWKPQGQIDLLITPDPVLCS